jgi:hypothetical protein
MDNYISRDFFASFLKTNLFKEGGLTPAGKVTNKLTTKDQLKMAERSEAKSAKVIKDFINLIIKI